MPLLEFAAAGKAISAAPWLVVKIAGVNSGSVAAVALTPELHGGGAHPLGLAGAALDPHSLWSGLQSLGSRVSELAGSAVDAVGAQHGGLAGFLKVSGSGSTICTSAIAVGAARALWASGLFAMTDEGKDGDENDEQGQDVRVNISVRTLRISAISDCCTLGLVIHSLGQPLAVPLRTWAVGGMLLSFPLTWLIDRLIKTNRCSSRQACLLEMVSCAASFAWLTYGTLLLSGDPMAVHHAPLLWWWCFAQCILTWSTLTTTIFGLVTATVIGAVCQGGGGG